MLGPTPRTVAFGGEVGEPFSVAAPTVELPPTGQSGPIFLFRQAFPEWLAL